MKLVSTLISGLGASVIIGSGAILYSEKPQHEGVKLVNREVSYQTHIILKNEPSLNTGNEPVSVPKELHPSLLSPVEVVLENNPSLKRRIMGMQWYRDFLTGALTQKVYEQYVIDAQTIEGILIQNPTSLNHIQYEIWWKRYLNGQTNPSDMLHGNMKTLLEIERFAREKPELYTKATKNPTWNLGIQYGEDFIVVGQMDFLTSLELRLRFLDLHPEIELKMREYGFTRENLFTDDWSQESGIYGYLNSLDTAKGINESK